MNDCNYTRRSGILPLPGCGWKPHLQSLNPVLNSAASRIYFA